VVVEKVRVEWGIERLVIKTNFRFRVVMSLTVTGLVGKAQPS